MRFVGHIGMNLATKVFSSPASRTQSFVFAVPVMLTLVLLLFMLPDTWKTEEMWRTGVPTIATVRHAAPDDVFLDFTASGQTYTTGGYQKPGSTFLALRDDDQVRLTYLPANPKMTTFNNSGSGLAAILLGDISILIVSILWVKFTWQRYLGWPPRLSTP
jgi:hypothetical protein